MTNFARVSLARDHSGTLEGLPLDTAGVPQLASQPQLADRWWRLGDGQVAGHDQVVERLLAAALLDPPARNGATDRGN